MIFALTPPGLSRWFQAFALLRLEVFPRVHSFE